MLKSIIYLSLLILLIMANCTTDNQKNEPFKSNSEELKNVTLKAINLCKEKRGVSNLPPLKFKTDGCSVWPDSDLQDKSWIDCCIKHDQLYWCGGSSNDRELADKNMRECVAKLGSPNIGQIMFIAVRLGGSPWFPYPWRWGYGWDWPKSYDD